MKAVLTLLMLIVVFALKAQTYPGDCTYYNKNGDRITVYYKDLPSDLDTNFIKANVLFEESRDTTSRWGYTIHEIKPWDVKAHKKRFGEKQDKAKYDYYLLRATCASLPKYREAKLEDTIAAIGGVAYLLMVDKDTKHTTLKFMWIEI